MCIETKALEAVGWKNSPHVEVEVSLFLFIVSSVQATMKEQQVKNFSIGNQLTRGRLNCF